jgi:uncharacterized membrane protein YgcG
MRGNPMKIRFLFVSAMGLALFVSCRSKVFLESTWIDTEIAYGADTAQWNKVMQYPDDPQFGIGVQNDGRYVYLRVISWKRDVNKQLLHFGFTTWFTSASKKGKRFGIHYPLGMRRNATAWRADKEGGSDPEEMKARMEESLQEMELLGPGKDDSVPVKTRVAESFGIAVRMFPSQENLIYEMKVPLREDSICKYAIDIGKDTIIEAAFESDVPDLSERSHGEGHGEGGGMGGGGGGGMHGGGGGRGAYGGGGGGQGGHERSAADEMPDQFKASFFLRLAGKPPHP